MVWPWPATKNLAVALLSTAPTLHPPPLPPRWVGEENQTKTAKLVGWDKDHLTEQERKQTVVTTILIRRTYKRNSGMHRATLSPPDAQFTPQQ